MTLVKCVKCGEVKEDVFFRKCSKKKNGLTSYCRQCEAYNCSKWLAKNVERNKQISKNNYNKNKEIRNIISKKDYEKNREKYIKLAIKYERERIANDPSYHFRKILRSRIRSSLKLYSKNGKTKSCSEYGIDFDEIFNKIGPRPGPNFHLDHIIPLIEFNLDLPEHVKLANSSDNLRWMLDVDNRKKHTKIIAEVENNPILKQIWNIIKTEPIQTQLSDIVSPQPEGIGDGLGGDMDNSPYAEHPSM